MRTIVSQRTIFIGGIPACPRCERRPRKAIPEGTLTRRRGRKFYGYCSVCGPDVERERRERIAQERDELLRLVDELRAARPAGKHHAR